MAENLSAPKEAAEGDSKPSTDEDLLRLRSRLDRELAVVGQKIADAEASIQEIETTLKGYEEAVRSKRGSRVIAGQAAEKITSRLRAMGDGLSKLLGKKEDEGSGGGDTPRPAPPKGFRDLEDRLGDTILVISQEIQDREKLATELDRRLHEGQKELIRLRANEQHAREMQLRIGQTKSLSEDLERKMALLDEMVRNFEGLGKAEPGLKPKPKEPQPAIPKLEDRLQGAIDEALKAVAAQEKKVAELEKEAEKARTALVDERARQQRIRAMQVRLRQIRYFSTDLQRVLEGLEDSIQGFLERAWSLLRPEKEGGEKAAPKPVAPATAGSRPPGS